MGVNLGAAEGLEVGLVGKDVGAGDGLAVGRDVGRDDGHRVGWLEVGTDVGQLVSPGLVGRDVAGELVGMDVGDVLVGIDVGADIITAWPTTTAASLIEDMEFFASDVSRSSAPTEAAARSNSLEKLPDETEAVT